jgi:hypothetical protein
MLREDKQILAINEFKANLPGTFPPPPRREREREKEIHKKNQKKIFKFNSVFETCLVSLKLTRNKKYAA